MVFGMPNIHFVIKQEWKSDDLGVRDPFHKSFRRCFRRKNEKRYIPLALSHDLGLKDPFYSHSEDVFAEKRYIPPALSHDLGLRDPFL